MLEDNKPLQRLEYEDCPKAIRVLSLTQVSLGQSIPLNRTWPGHRFRRSQPTGVAILPFPGMLLPAEVVEMPGCVELGVRVFSKCCALECVGNIVDGL